MRRIMIFAACVLALYPCMNGVVTAQGNARAARSTPPPNYPAPVQGDFSIHDFSFRSGEALPALKLHYTTIGTPVRDGAGMVRNAVLILHGTGGTGRAVTSRA